MLQQPTLVFIHSGGGSQGERWLMIGAWSKVYIETALASAKNQNRKTQLSLCRLAHRAQARLSQAAAACIALAA